MGKPDAYAGELPIAYVTLKKDAETSSEALLVYAREMIPERAVIPKDIYILEQMPLTPVGKVFKPDLRKDAMKRVLTEALSFLRDEAQVAISVAENSKSGTLARITLAGVPMNKREMLRQRIAGVLEAFTFKYRLEFLESG